MASNVIARRRPPHTGGAVPGNGPAPRWRTRLTFHGPAIAAILTVTLVLTRHFVFSTAIPAGTDMFGFVARASQYASLDRIVDTWSVDSFGSRRVFNFDNVVGLADLVMRNPVLAIKLIDIATILVAGFGAYALSWKWYRSRSAATVAGVLYLSSQALLTRWGSGQLNVEAVMATAPLMLLMLANCLERYSIRHASALALLLGTGFLIRPDLLLYILPFLMFYVIYALLVSGNFIDTAKSTLKTTAFVVPAVLIINAAWLIPLLTGYRPMYETLAQLFSSSQISAHSLNFYPSLLGFGREIGYLDFTNAQTWYSYPGLPLWAYYALATVVPLLAYSALWWRRDRRTVFLVLSAVIATFAAPGTRAPLGSLYFWAVRSLPVIGNLRDPNRWLVGQAVAYSLLAGVSITSIAKYRGRVRRSLAPIPRKALHATAVGSLLVIALMPVMPTFWRGLMTWRITSGQMALMENAAGAPSQSVIATVPFDQDYRFLVQGSYRGYEHDLGKESALVTGHSAVGDGDWNQSSANFVAYLATLLDRRDPAFAAMLASAGVHNLLSFNYPLVAPQLASVVGPYSQQHAAARMKSLTTVLRNPAGTDYTLSDSASPLSFRPNIGVILGGSQGIAALADEPGFKLPDWAMFTADSVISSRGYPALLALIKRAKLIVLAGERPLDIAVQGARALGQGAGITSDPQLDRSETNVPTDQSAQAGSMNDVTLPIPLPESSSSSSTLTVRSAQPVEIWARMLVGPQAAAVSVRVDGKVAGSVAPMTIGTGGFEWVRLATVRLGKGQHTITIAARPSPFGDSYEVEEVREIAPGALTQALGQLNSVLASRASRLGYAFNLGEVAKWSWRAIMRDVGPASSRSWSAPAWQVPPGAGTRVARVRGPAGQNVTRITAIRGRAVYSIATLIYKRAADWSGRPYIYLRFKGTGSGKTYQIVFLLGSGATRSVQYSFTDKWRGWHTLAFPTEAYTGAGLPVSWAHVVSVRLALPSKDEAASVELGSVRPSKLLRHVTIRLPVLPSTRPAALRRERTSCVGGVHITSARLLARSASLRIAVGSLSPSCNVYVPPTAKYRQVPASAIRIKSSGLETWNYSFSSSRSGAVVWTQAYDPLWQMSGHGGVLHSLPELALLNGYLVSAGRHAGVVRFAGETPGVLGVGVTALSICVLVVLAEIPRRRRRTRFDPGQPAGGAVRGSRDAVLSRV